MAFFNSQTCCNIIFTSGMCSWALPSLFQVYRLNLVTYRSSCKLNYCTDYGLKKQDSHSREWSQKTSSVYISLFSLEVCHQLLVYYNKKVIQLLKYNRTQNIFMYWKNEVLNFTSLTKLTLHNFKLIFSHLSIAI